MSLILRYVGDPRLGTMLSSTAPHHPGYGSLRLPEFWLDTYFCLSKYVYNALCSFHMSGPRRLHPVRVFLGGSGPGLLTIIEVIIELV
jgi:hypothetical protein